MQVAWTGGADEGASWTTTTWWYSPEVRNFVKVLDEGVREVREGEGGADHRRTHQSLQVLTGYRLEPGFAEPAATRLVSLDEAVQGPAYHRIVTKSALPVDASSPVEVTVALEPATHSAFYMEHSAPLEVVNELPAESPVDTDAYEIRWEVLNGGVFSSEAVANGTGHPFTFTVPEPDAYVVRAEFFEGGCPAQHLASSRAWFGTYEEMTLEGTAPVGAMGDVVVGEFAVHRSTQYGRVAYDVAGGLMPQGDIVVLTEDGGEVHMTTTPQGGYEFDVSAFDEETWSVAWRPDDVATGETVTARLYLEFG